MPDYKAMYLRLHSAYCDVIERLQKATLETEQMAMDAAEPISLYTLPEEEVPKCTVGEHEE